MKNIDRLLSLLDSAKPIIELWNVQTVAQQEWKKKWLKEVKEILLKKQERNVNKLKELPDTGWWD